MPCVSAAEAGEAVARLTREHHAASHVAFAWKLGTGGAAATRSSDAGEPSGTAGRPIAAAIEAAGLTDLCVAVVRYFGGTKLGKGGLARAYRGAAERALRACGSRPVYERARILVTCPYARVGAVKKLVRSPDIVVEAEEFGQDSKVTLAVRKSLADEVRRALNDARLDFSTED